MEVAFSNLNIYIFVKCQIKKILYIVKNFRKYYLNTTCHVMIIQRYIIDTTCNQESTDD